MPLDVVIPDVGEAGMEVTFQGWLKAAGDGVAAGEPLFELDTDKSVIEVEAFEDGVLWDLRVAAGDAVSARQVVALLLGPGEPPPPDGAARTGSGDAASAPDADAAPPPRRERAGGVEAMPRARRMAEELGVDLEALAGTGPDGAITVADVEAARRRDPMGEAEAPGHGERNHRRDRARRATAGMTSAAWRSIPHFHLTLEADLTHVLERLRPTEAVCHAFATALARHPESNLEWRGEGLVRRSTVDLGLLVDTPDGLRLPVIRDAAALDADGLEAAIAAAAERARGGALRADDRGPRSASVSNLGMFAVDAVAGVIAAPDVLLLSVGRVRTVPRRDAGEWVARRVATLTLSVDHRALDGADAARLLATLEAGLGSEAA